MDLQILPFVVCMHIYILWDILFDTWFLIIEYWQEVLSCCWCYVLYQRVKVNKIDCISQYTWFLKALLCDKVIYGVVCVYKICIFTRFTCYLLHVTFYLHLDSFSQISLWRCVQAFISKAFEGVFLKSSFDCNIFMVIMSDCV